MQARTAAGSTRSSRSISKAGRISQARRAERRRKDGEKKKTQPFENDCLRKATRQLGQLANKKEKFEKLRKSAEEKPQEKKINEKYLKMLELGLPALPGMNYAYEYAHQHSCEFASRCARPHARAICSYEFGCLEC